jgi:hypothetical protein
LPQVKLFYDQVGNTLTVWFGEMLDDYVAEDAGPDAILIKDRTGRVIGFEKVNVGPNPEHLSVTLETVSTRP